MNKYPLYHKPAPEELAELSRLHNEYRKLKALYESKKKIYDAELDRQREINRKVLYEMYGKYIKDLVVQIDEIRTTFRLRWFEEYLIRKQIGLIK